VTSTRRRHFGVHFARAYWSLYGNLCGRHPHLRLCHAQWLSSSILYRSLRPILEGLEGEVLDVGCESSPYRDWLVRATGYTGLDIRPGPHVDAVVSPSGSWPLSDGRFDAVICTQVVEHVASFANTLSELHRVTRPGGTLVLSVPFIYNEHGTPADYWRLSRNGVEILLGRTWEIIAIQSQGGVGSSVGVLFLNWAEQTLTRTGVRLLALLAVLPAWMGFCAAVNSVGFLLDRLDQTSLFYGNVLVVARRPIDGRPQTG
jgi:SAM-dependent methyltransferase